MKIMSSARCLLLFVLIQIVSLLLSIIGVPIVALCLQFGAWPSWAWLWFNDEDGYGPDSMNKWAEFVWLALRNPVANLKHVRGVSKVGRPLWYWSNGKHYAKAGWMSNGYPCLSAGSGKGF